MILMDATFGVCRLKVCADYTFLQHIQKSLDAQNGRSFVLWPHGVLFRDSEGK